jgi:hypothetical protein
MPKYTAPETERALTPLLRGEKPRISTGSAADRSKGAILPGSLPQTGRSLSGTIAQVKGFFGVGIHP